MKKYEHGGNIYKQKVRYDFSANINPLGMPQNVKKVLADSIDAFEKYPDVNCTELKAVIAKKYHLTPENIVCGNGAIDILYRVISVIKPKNCLLAAPCFSEYEKALLENGSQIKYYFRKEENGYKIKNDYLVAMNDIDMLILCQPNNPTGDLTDRKIVEKILRRAVQKRVFVIIDKCFMDFVTIQGNRAGEVGSMVELTDNVMIINAFTKIYAMAGLRLGFGISSNVELIKQVGEYGAEWNVSVPAQIAGVAALRNSDYIVVTRDYIAEERKYLTEELRKLGIKVFDAEANFLLIYEENDNSQDNAIPVNGSINQSGNMNQSAKGKRLGNNNNLIEIEEAGIFDYLMAKGIMIRDCSNFVGLKKGYYRIAVRTHEENEILVSALKEYRRDIKLKLEDKNG